MIAVSDFAALNVPAPTMTAVSAPFWDGAADGRLMLQRCESCARWVFYPRTLCPHCWSATPVWREASGCGRLRTWSVQHRPGHPGWEPVAPYTIGLVGLDEGPTMVSHILAAPEALRPGMQLRVRFVGIGTIALPFFEPTP